MNAQRRTLILAVISIMASNAFGMTYPAPKPIFIAPTFPPPPPPPPVSICTTDSNTIAVGIEYYTNGARIVCADAGQIGFWTVQALGSGVIGTVSPTATRFMCPSGMALSGVIPATGFPLPIPVCSMLVPNLQDGSVTKGSSNITGGNRCDGNKFIQSLKGMFNSQGTVNDLVPICNPILTTPAPTQGFDVDLAVRTINQAPTLGQNSSDAFAIQVFNTGIGTVPMGDIRVEMRFDVNAWDVTPISNVSCQPMLALSLGQLKMVGKRCTMPGTELGPRGGNVSTPFMLQPVGPASGRPVTFIAAPIVSVKVVLTEGTAANDANDRAAFPVKVLPAL